MSEERTPYSPPQSVVELLRLEHGPRLHVARYEGGYTVVYLDPPPAWRSFATGTPLDQHIRLGSGHTPEEAIRGAIDVFREWIEALERELGRAEV